MQLESQPAFEMNRDPRSGGHGGLRSRQNNPRKVQSQWWKWITLRRKAAEEFWKSPKIRESAWKGKRKENRDEGRPGRPSTHPTGGRPAPQQRRTANTTIPERISNGYFVIRFWKIHMYVYPFFHVAMFRRNPRRRKENILPACRRNSISGVYNHCVYSIY